MVSLDSTRQEAQIALLASGAPISFGTAGWRALPDDLRAAAEDTSGLGWLDGGLTAWVRRVDRRSGPVAIKKARPQALVRNRDGELSFVNELLRRRELLELSRRGHPIGGLTPTLHASLATGVIVSPWIDGTAVETWDERLLSQFFATGIELVLEGFFEWDFSPGNVLDDGQQLWLFDFGYMYRFDALRQFNTAGNGVDCPQFHLAERFESRNFFSHLLRAEQSNGLDAALSKFRLEKQLALQAYEELHTRLLARGAGQMVSDFYTGIVRDWKRALRGDLGGLYLREAWRSHRADLNDDLQGQTCTPMTLTRARWLIERVHNDHAALLALGALEHGDDRRGRGALLEQLQRSLATAQAFQLQMARPGRSEDSARPGSVEQRL